MHLLYLLFFSFIVLGENVQHAAAESDQDRILFVVSNADYYGESDITTANHFTELVIPYDVLSKAGYAIDFVSPQGGAVPIGYINASDTMIKQYLYDCSFMEKLAQTKQPDAIDAALYQAIYYGGGGAAMFGVAENKAIQNIAMQIYGQNQGVISALCHGSIGIANLKNEDGSYFVAGKVVNGFPDKFENKDARYFEEFDHSVETLLQKRGAQFNYSEEGWDSYFRVDGRLITGQDPSSAKKVAQEIILALKAAQTKN